MTADQPMPLFSQATPCRRWRIVLADGEVRTVEAAAIRCEHGALLLVMPAGLVSAYAPGTWATVEGAIAEIWDLRGRSRDGSHSRIFSPARDYQNR